MTQVRVVPINSIKQAPIAQASAYLMINTLCDCVAVISNYQTKKDIEQIINKIQSLEMQLDWILITGETFSTDLIVLLQAKSGGVIAGNKMALSKFDDTPSFGDCQFEELSDHQIILLGHIELLIQPSGIREESYFIIDNNMFCPALNSFMKTFLDSPQEYANNKHVYFF